MGFSAAVLLFVGLMIVWWCLRDRRRRVMSLEGQVSLQAMLVDRSSEASSTKRSSISWESLEIMQQLGRGGFGVVHLARWQGELVAVKKVIHMSPQAKEELWREFERMLPLRSPRIIQVMHCVDEPGTGNLCVIMEYAAGGSLRQRLDHLQSDGGATHLAALGWANDMAQGMDYLHSVRVMHCDLKSPNVLLNSNAQCQVSDFGLAKSEDFDVDPSESKSFATMPDERSRGMQSMRTLTVKGSPPWMSPEAINGQRSLASDRYAYGIVLWEMITGEWPWKGVPFVTVLYRVVVELARPPVPLHLQEHVLYSLMTESWDIEEDKRPKFAICSQRIQALLLEEKKNAAPPPMNSAPAQFVFTKMKTAASFS